MKDIYTNKNWITLRKSILDKHDCICAICGKQRWSYKPRKDEWVINGRWAVHHLTYERAGGNERVEDVVPLCYLHHQMLHLIMDSKRETAIVSELQDVLKKHLYKEIVDDINN